MGRRSATEGLIGVTENVEKGDGKWNCRSACGMVGKRVTSRTGRERLRSVGRGERGAEMVQERKGGGNGGRETALMVREWRRGGGHGAARRASRFGIPRLAEAEQARAVLLKENALQARDVVEVVLDGARHDWLHFGDLILMAQIVELADLMQESTAHAAPQAGHVGRQERRLLHQPRLFRRTFRSDL